MLIKKPSSYLIWPLKITLFSSGNYPEYKIAQRIGALLVIISYLTAFYSSLTLVINSSNIFMATESLSVFTLILLCFCETLAVILHKSMFAQALERFENEIDPQFVEMINRRFIKMVIIAFEIIIMVELPYQSSGLITALFFDVELGTPESLLYPVHIPWRYDTKIRYFYVLLWQVINVIHPFLIGYGIIATFCALFTHINAKFELLLASIANLENIDTGAVPLNEQILVKRVDGDFVYSNHLREVIREYQNWKKTAMGLISFIADWSGIILGCVTSCSIFVMANILEPEIPVHLKIKSFCLFVFIFSHVFVVCFLGEYFQNANDKIRDAIYDTTWYTKSTKIQKTIITLMLQIQVPMTVKVYRMITVNTSLVLRMVRIIYSISNLYRTAYL